MCLTVSGVSGAPTTLGVASGRPVTINYPNNFNRRKLYPLIIGLHGLGGSSAVGKWFSTMLSAIASGPGCIVLEPTGTIATISGDLFWNSADPCCNFSGPNPDDTTYLANLIIEAKSLLPVDPRYVVVFGYSNGGFMANTLARCHPELVTHAMSYAGMGIDATRDTGSGPVADTHFCAIASPVHYTHVHGTSDTVIVYTGDPGPGDTVGGDTAIGPYLSAVQSCDRWVTANGGVGAMTVVGSARDFVAALPGNESDILEPATSQGANGSVVLVRVNGGAHVQGMNTAFTNWAQERIWSAPRV